MVKLNTDGSALDNPDSLGVGGVCRNNRGDLLFAFTTPMGVGTNNQAQLKAAFFGLSWCVNLWYKVILEMDSDLAVNWIRQQAHPPWFIDQILNKIHNIISQFQVFRCKQVYREANFVANTLSKHGHNVTSPSLYFSTHQLPREARAYFELDKLKL